MNIKTFIVACCILNIAYISLAQDISLLQLQGTMPATFLNPGLKLDKTWNTSVGGISFLLGTDGPSINDLTSKNALGQRYIDVKKLPQNADLNQNIYFTNDIHTLDLGVKIGSFVLMGGHAFRSSANLRYPTSMVELFAQGNAAFIGKQIQIGPALDVLAFNEVYLGAQKSIGNFTLGVKGKLLYGTSSISTESSDILFTTKPEFYQLELKNDYLVRSSALFRYFRSDSISLNYSGFTFDNLFYNNRGIAFDLGATFRVSDQLTFSASALDIGSISWDYFPRKYTSKGTFTFEGLDLVRYIGDTTTIAISDTLLNIIKVKSALESYSTPLNNTFTLGGIYSLDSRWILSALYMLKNDFGYRKNILSLSAVRKTKLFDAGLQYTISKNNYAAIGIFGRVKLGPVSVYCSTENLPALINPLNHKSASIRAGIAVQF
jgi:hypothetical protein